ncbi:MAG: LuxR C-terminal-related transcriptional regulator [Anaerolineae bacterium]|jgi:LuxR family maltose regulon positive regulatory protein
MTTPLLSTKLYVPRPRSNLLSRPRLIQRLEEGLRRGRRLTLISAPAGYGKTTLLSEWAADTDQKVAWLSLDEDDNDPVRYWTYVIAALQRVVADLGRGIPDALRSPQHPPIEVLLVPLINQIAARPDALVLVLDDYHLVTARAIHDALAFLLDHLPDNLHLVIAGRADPPLVLARLRGRGQLTEIRQADLRFTADEAAVFLEGVSGLDLAAEEIGTLEERTEGWITGLQLAALSMRGREDVSGFVSAFAGSHRYVLDYLAEEVLQRQPEEVRDFLLQTSVLDRLSGSLCDAVLRVGERADGQKDKARPLRPFPDSQAMLEHLEARNLFVVPLDDRRVWYRYHRLFADLLRARLEQLRPEQVPVLHRRASAWFERAGMLDEAMGHAIAGGHAARTAQIVEVHGRSLLFRGELTTLLRWIAALPEKEIQASARICVTHAWALLLTGQSEPIEPLLQQTEDMVAPDNPLLGDVAAIRAYATARRSDIPRTIELAELALERLPPSKLGERAVALFVLAGAHLFEGRVSAAADAFSKAATAGQEGGNLHLALPALDALASIEVSQGRLHEAETTAREAIRLITGPDGHPPPIAAGAISVLAELAYEWNRLDEAIALARQSVELARLWGNADPLVSGYLTLADVLVARGRLDEARDALRDAERLSRDVAVFPSLFSLLQATRARLWLHEGDLAAAGQWADEVTPRTTHAADLTETLTLAQVRLALGRPDAALDAVAALLEVARAEGLVSWLIRGLAVQALAHHAHDRRAQALNAVAEALTLAAPEGHVRSFVDLGPAMAALLKQAAARGIAPDYVGHLLSALGLTDDDLSTPEPQVLIEPLSARELEVLALAAEGLSNRDVGRRLHIAESTVKSHLNSVYGKLGVRNRTQAAAKAKALNLL